MAQRNKTTYKALYGSTGTKYPDNTTELILESTFREEGEDIADSFIFNSDLAPLEIATAADLTLNFNGLYERDFYGDASFAAAKLVITAGDTNAKRFTLAFEITNVAATLDFGSGSIWKSTSNDFNPATQIFTFSMTGFILITGTKVGSNWWLTVDGPFA